LSSDRERSAFIALLLIVLVAVPVYAYGYRSTQLPSTQQRYVIGDLQLQSTSVDITGLSSNGLSLSLKAVVYNPYGFGAALDAANYSAYADGHYIGAGQTARAYDLAPQSSQSLVFPISVGWKSALKTTGIYLVGLGDVTWKVNGTAKIEIGGFLFPVPFEFATG
jgi:LEA14-like dessication related protein